MKLCINYKLICVKPTKDIITSFKVLHLPIQAWCKIYREWRIRGEHINCSLTITLTQVSQVVNHVLGTFNFKDDFDYWLRLEIVPYGNSNYVSQRLLFQVSVVELRCKSYKKSKWKGSFLFMWPLRPPTCIDYWT